MTRDEKSAWLWLAELPGVGAKRFGDLLERFGSVDEVLGAEAAELEGIVPSQAVEGILSFEQKEAHKLLEKYEKLGARVVCKRDEEYPRLLAGYDWAPPVLYVRGELLPEDARALAVVGTRKPTDYGRQMTRQLVKELVAHGFAIVSGLAYGIDGEAHKSALAGGGRTIAVLGTGIDRVYPAAHQRLAEEIVESGALVSMFPVGQQVSRARFAIRNRIVAGMSMGVLVTEAAVKSGTQITVNYAKAQGKPVFAVPGPANGAMSSGPLSMIKEGAVMTRSYKDVCDCLGEDLAEEARSRSELSGLQQQIYEALEVESLTTDELGAKLACSLSQVMEGLVELEILGLVKSLGGRWFLE